MAKIATCPKCAKQLGLPDTAALLDRAECPECHTVFSLAETVQIALPVARVLAPAEPESDPEQNKPKQTQAEPSVAQPQMAFEDSPQASSNVLANAIADEPSNAPQRPSWEERLKKALALDGSEDSGEPEQDEVEQPSIERPPVELPETDKLETDTVKLNLPKVDAPKTLADPAPAKSAPAKSFSPSFDFQLDPPPAEVEKPLQQTLDLELPASLPEQSPEQLSEPAKVLPPKPAAERSKSPAKTLAQFASAATLPELASKKEKPKPKAKQKPAKPSEAMVAKTKPTLAKSVAKRSPTAKSTKPTPPPATDRRRAERGFSKVAAFAVGPVLGSLLGLYGLLWFQGERADYLRLSHVLPVSVLPASFGAGIDTQSSESSLVESTSPVHKLLAGNKSVRPLMKRDEAVTRASANQSLPSQSLSAPRITASEFLALVDAAEATLPDLVEQEMSTPESIKRKGQAYMALCRLAENFDFAKQLGLSPTLQTKARYAVQLYRRVTSHPEALQDLAHIAGRWWEYEQRPTSGIFLTGTVRNAQTNGSGTLCWVKVSEDSTVAAIPVWLNRGTYQAGEQIGIVGRVISDPTQLPQNFSGKRIIRAEHTFAL